MLSYYEWVEQLESKDWIQGAVNPAHKGFCSPESKSTCTPARKALADRFKKGGDIYKDNEKKHEEDKHESLNDLLDQTRTLLDKISSQETQPEVVQPSLFNSPGMVGSHQALPLMVR